MKQTQTGFILLVTLIFLLIFSLWSLVLIHHVGAMAELNQQYFTRVKLIQAGLKILTDIETNHEVKEQTRGAHLQDFSYDYAVESLGCDACTLIEKSNQIAQFYRIKLKLTANRLNHLSTEINSIWVAASDAKTVCANEVKTVAPGRQIWFET